MRRLRFLPPALLVLQLLLPACEGIAYLAGMEFTLYNKDIFIIASTAVMTAGAVILWFWGPEHPYFYLLLPPAALLNSFLWMGGPHPAVVFAAPLNALVSIAPLVRRGSRGKILCSIACLLPALYLGFLGAVSVFFSGWVEPTVVRELPSPDHRYVARVIDMASFDRETVVSIQKTHRISLLIGELACPQHHIYWGEGGEYQTMTMEWTDKDTLIINGEYYHMEELP